MCAPGLGGNVTLRAGLTFSGSSGQQAKGLPTDMEQLDETHF